MPEKDVTPTAVVVDAKPAKRPRGYPPRILTPEIMETIRKSLLAGCKHETASNLAGIGVRTFYEWRQKGTEFPRSEYGDFARMVRGAEAQCQRGLSAAVMLATRKDGRLALEMLRARWPRLWQQKESVHAEISASVEVEVTDGELTRRLDRLTARFREGSGDHRTNGRLKPGT
jgi:hypothetical protein